MTYARVAHSHRVRLLDIAWQKCGGGHLLEMGTIICVKMEKIGNHLLLFEPKEMTFNHKFSKNVVIFLQFCAQRKDPLPLSQA